MPRKPAPPTTADDDRLVFLFSGRVSDLTALAVQLGEIKGVDVPAAVRAKIDAAALRWAREEMAAVGAKS